MTQQELSAWRSAYRPVTLPAAEPEGDGPIGRFDGQWSFLSNFYLSPVEYEGVLYPSVEHAYQAAKTLNGKERASIATLYSAESARHVGKTVKLRDGWDEMRLEVMGELLAQKFEYPDLREALVSTGERELVEGNFWHDRFWGKCTCGKCGGTKEEPVGENYLGLLLMSVREAVRP